jgi:regulator of RNase E activity RraA
MTQVWKTPEDLFQLARRELFTGVVGDVMDKMGLRNQFLPPQIHAVSPEMVVIGPAMTVLETDVFSEPGSAAMPNGLKQPFGIMLDALDDLKPHEVYICTGSSPRYALWGELMSTRAMTLGATGVVVDGYLRDTKGILQLKFPSFAYGSYAQDQGGRGIVIDFRTPIEIGCVRIGPGDIVFGDIDGVCVVPSNAIEEVFTRALEKCRGEKKVQRALQEGISAKQAFQTYGIM